MTIEIEVDGANNEHMVFRPLLRTIRGRFDLLRCRDPKAMELRTKYPVPIPGLCIVLNVDKASAVIVDPLHGPACKPIRERIEARGLKLGPEREEFQNVAVNDWAFWLKRAVDAGIAKVVSGTWPEIDAAKARKNFILAPKPQEPDARDSVINKLVGLVYALVPADRKKEIAALLEG